MRVDTFFAFGEPEQEFDGLPGMVEADNTLVPNTAANRALWQAVASNDIAAAKKAFAQGADPNLHVKTPGYGDQIVFWVLGPLKDDGSDRAKAAQIARLFVENGFDVKKLSDGSSPLVVALILKSTDLLKFMLDKGAGLNSVGAGEQNVGNVVNQMLLFTFGEREQETLPFLEIVLERGANPNVYTGAGRTPLHSAVPRAALNTVRLLLEQGADPSLPTKQNTRKAQTALMMAREQAIRGRPSDRKANAEIISLLEEAERKQKTTR